jgi:hypothetical protein
MKTCWFIVIESCGSWWVDCEGKAYGPVSSKEQAVTEAKKLARIFGDPERRSDLWSPDDSGKLQLVWSGEPPAV